MTNKIKRVSTRLLYKTGNNCINDLEKNDEPKIYRKVAFIDLNVKCSKGEGITIQ